MQDLQDERDLELKEKEKEECLNSLLDRELTRNSLKAIAKNLNLKDNYYNYYSVNKIIEWLHVQGYCVEVIEPKYKNHGKKYKIGKPTDF